MHLLGRNRIADLSEAGLKSWVTYFVTELRYSNFKRDTDIHDHFPKSVRLPDGTFVFPMAGVSTSLHVAFSFKTATAIILGVRSAQ